MRARSEDTQLINQALCYVTELFRELSQENGAPTLGTQNQAVDYILADAELSRMVTLWARTAPTEEATTAPRQRLPHDAAYRRIRDHLAATMRPPGGPSPTRSPSGGSGQA